MFRGLAAVALLAVCLGTTCAEASAKGIQHFFFGPGVTTSCEMNIGVPKIPTSVYCQTYPHTESVILSPKGKLTICHGNNCIGNPPEQIPTLVYGSWIDGGPFRCTSKRAGVQCVVRSTGHGFLIAPTSIKRV
ncbi:MAG TPA: hypothetical protein VH063_02935 [Gaiellaceae bacterium]|nr:hypothetical protein [Gaiellaceae bacterium]